EAMITNGANIPRVLWNIPGFAPFDFARAAVIHDWLYEAHHRYGMAAEALKTARKRHDQPAINRNLADVEAYKEYAKVDQDDAADIFAECIKVTMLQSRDMIEADDGVASQQSDRGNGSQGVQEFKSALGYTRPSSHTLWVYHYFVSRDAVIKKGTRIWDDKRCDDETYRFLTSDKRKKLALKKDSLSP